MEGWAFTVNLYVAIAVVHGSPKGLLEVRVIVTSLPASVSEGVYVNEKGDVLIVAGLTVPPPFSVILMAVALPPKVFPVTETIEVPQILLPELLRTTTGGFTQPHDTAKADPAVMHPDEFLAEI